MRPTLLLGRRRIARAVARLARSIESDRTDTPLLLVPMLRGGFVFAADLVRRLTGPFRLEFGQASSYGAGRTSGDLVLTLPSRDVVEGQDVVVLDDILDTGRTARAALDAFKDAGAARLRLYVLLDKPSRRVVPVHPDGVGFTIPDLFVVGYGMDIQGKWRGLPWIGYL